jgi:hypothetical protein
MVSDCLEGCYSSEHSLQPPLKVVTQVMRFEPVFKQAASWRFLAGGIEVQGGHE